MARKYGKQIFLLNPNYCTKELALFFVVISVEGKQIEKSSLKKTLKGIAQKLPPPPQHHVKLDKTLASKS